MLTPEQCATILGISSAASIEEIKRAYRAKVKTTHPDRNKAPTAQEDFIKIVEAYETLLQYKNTGSASYAAAEEEHIQREHIKRQARAYSEMRYREFIQSDYYKTITSIEIIARGIYILLSLFVVTGLVLVLASISPLAGILFFVMLILSFRLFIKDIFLQATKLRFDDFWDALLFILHKPIFFLVVFYVVSVFVFFHIGMNTLMPLSILIGSYLVAVPLVLLFIYFNKQISLNSMNIALGICVVWFGISSFLFLNKLFSHNPTEETYAFQKEAYVSKRGYSETSKIILENNIYSEYAGIRIFFDYDELRSKRYIKYTISDGLFGLRVMMDYKLAEYKEILEYKILQ